MNKLISAALVALILPVTSLAAPGSFGGLRGALLPVEDASCEDVLDFVNITIEFDVEEDGVECALLLAELKRTLGEMLNADLIYESCMAEVEREGSSEALCNEAKARLNDAAHDYRMAAQEYTSTCPDW